MGTWDSVSPSEPHRVKMAHSGGFVFLKLAVVAWTVVWTLGVFHRRKSSLQILTSEAQTGMKLGGMQLSPKKTVLK